MPRYDLAGNPLPDDPPSRTDLAGNPLPASGPPPAYGASPAAYGQQAAVWPPPSVGAYGRPPQQNTSGQQGSVPPEIEAMKWNWGAFGLPFFWSLGHKMYGLAFIAFVLNGGSRLLGVVGVIAYYSFAIYMGVTGNRIAWRKRRFEGGVTQFIDTQRVWMGWGVASTIFCILVLGAVTYYGLTSK